MAKVDPCPPPAARRSVAPTMGPVPEQVLPGTSTGPLNKVNTLNPKPFTLAGRFGGGTPRPPGQEDPDPSPQRVQGPGRPGGRVLKNLVFGCFGCSLAPLASLAPWPPWPPWPPGPPGPPGPPWPPRPPPHPPWAPLASLAPLAPLAPPGPPGPPGPSHAPSALQQQQASSPGPPRDRLSWGVPGRPGAHAPPGPPPAQLSRGAPGTPRTPPGHCPGAPPGR